MGCAARSEPCSGHSRDSHVFGGLARRARGAGLSLGRLLIGAARQEQPDHPLAVGRDQRQVHERVGRTVKCRQPHSNLQK